MSIVHRNSKVKRYERAILSKIVYKNNDLKTIQLTKFYLQKLASGYLPKGPLSIVTPKSFNNQVRDGLLCQFS
jgi:hypothetical protein